MFGQLPMSPAAQQKLKEYAQDKAKIFRGSQEWIFGITVAAIGGMMAQIYAYKILKKESKIK